MLVPELIFEPIEKENLQIWGLDLQLFNYQFQKKIFSKINVNTISTKQM